MLTNLRRKFIGLPGSLLVFVTCLGYTIFVDSFHRHHIFRFTHVEQAPLLLALAAKMVLSLNPIDVHRVYVYSEKHILGGIELHRQRTNGFGDDVT